MIRTTFARTLLASCALLALSCFAHAHPAASPWPAGDELGMANTLGPATWKRCAPYLANAKAKSYELSHIRSNTMPQSPFGTPLVDKYRPTVGIPGTMHAFNGEETVSGEPGAAGHADGCDRPFCGAAGKVGRQERLSADRATYYGGYTQKRGEAHAGLAAAEARHREGAADRHHRGAARRQDPSRQGQGDGAGRAVTTDDIEAMLKAEGLGKRGLLPGDVLYIYTGWGDNWKDPDTEKFYYTKGPGLAYDAAKYIAEKKVVLVALDNPFTDPVADGFLQGKAAPAEGTPPACRSRSITRTCRSPASTRSRTPISANWPRTRSGCPAP